MSEVSATTSGATNSAQGEAAAPVAPASEIAATSSSEGTTAGFEDFAHTGQGQRAGYLDRPLEEFHSQYRGEYIEPRATAFPVEPFGSPQKIADLANPKQLDGPAWQVNCADVSRAVERTWRGSEEFPAGRTAELYATPVGEDYDRMEDWSGQELHNVTDANDIRDRLVESGPGSSAVVETQYSSAFDEHATGGHAFNVVNHEGRVVVIDGQVGRTFDWANGTGHPAMGRTWDTKVVGWDRTGVPLWRA